MKIKYNSNKGQATVAGLVASGLVVIVVGFLVWCAAAANFEVPAGYVGYITQGSVFGKVQYIGTIEGPTSTGKTWLIRGVNVSTTPYTYTEDFSGGTAVLSKDELKIGFNIHFIFKVKKTDVKSFVEQYSTLGDTTNPNGVVLGAYNNLIKERLRTCARDNVQKYNAMQIKDNISLIGDTIQKDISTICEKTPFEVLSIVVGNIQYPDAVSNAVANKLATQQELETKSILIEIAKKNAEQRVAEAEGIAKAMNIVQTKLTPMYLQHEAIEAQKAMVGSPNHTTIYIPVGHNGVPLVGTVNEPKQ